MMILPGMSLAEAKSYANTVREQVAHLRIEYRREWLGQMTITAGVAVYPTHGRSAEAVLAAADAALYRAKRGGRDCVCVGDEDVTREALLQMEPGDGVASEYGRDGLARQTAVAGSEDR
jgi:predicted signal transduction protein with EAL and GGDEF domain